MRTMQVSVGGMWRKTIRGDKDAIDLWTGRSGFALDEMLVSLFFDQKTFAHVCAGEADQLMAPHFSQPCSRHRIG